MKIQNFSQLKKYFANPDAEIELIYFNNPNHKWLNIKRKVEKCQTNAVKFIGGSWLQFEKAGNYRFHEDNTFDVIDDYNGKVILIYKYF